MQFTRVSAAVADVSGTCRSQPSDHQLSALASLHRDVMTKKHARLALRHNGFSGSTGNVGALVDRIAHINCAHRNRAANHLHQRLGHFPERARFQLAALNQTSKNVTLNGRLEGIRRKAVLAAAQACFRHGAAGGSSFAVSLTRDPQAVGYRVCMGSNRETYCGAFKGWQASEDHHRICVPADWRIRVQRRGLAVVGGMMTLDVQPLVAHGDIELFQAVWAGQGRGYAVTVQRGVMARLGEEVYHAQDAQHAIRGVMRKAQRAVTPRRQPVSAYALSVEAFVERYARFGGIEVDVEDARDTGACEYGIQSWCHAVGIDMAKKRALMSSILEGFRSQPQTEVRRTVLQAVKRHRAEMKREAAASAREL